MGIEFGGKRSESGDRSRETRPPENQPERRGIWGREVGEFTGWRGNLLDIDGPENRGYGGLESTRLKAVSVSNTTGWPEHQLQARLSEVKALIGFPCQRESATKWWNALENENKGRLNLILRLAEEIGSRGATIDDFFLAYVYSGTDNIQENLNFLDGAIKASQARGISLKTAITTANK